MEPKLFWALWFGVVIGSFAVAETYYLLTVGAEGTLSVWMREFGQDWPALKWIFLGGAIFLFLHFWYQRYLSYL